MIFDVTLKDIKKLDSISRDVKKLGYDTKNIHIVWVINDIEVAREQNKTRDRIVSDDILFDAHQGVALTMSKIVKNTVNLSNYMDGDIWFVFNKAGVDSTLSFSKLNKKVFIIDDAETVLLKRRGQNIDKKKLTNDVLDKIKKYTPEVNGSFE